MFINNKFAAFTLKFAAVFVVFLFALSASAADASKQSKRIMVWRITAGTGVTEKDINTLSEFYAAQVEKITGMAATSESDIEKVLKTAEDRAKCGAENIDCLVEISNALGVPEVAAGDLGKVGDLWILTLRLIDAKNVKVIKRISRQIKGTLTNVVEALNEMTSELFQGYSKSEATAGNETKESFKLTPFKKAAVSTFVPGAALMIFGGVAAWRMDKAASDFSYGGKSADKDSQKLWKNLSITGFALGGAAVIAGAVLWFVDPDVKNEKNVQVSAFWVKNGGFATVSWDW